MNLPPDYRVSFFSTSRYVCLSAGKNDQDKVEKLNWLLFWRILLRMKALPDMKCVSGLRCTCIYTRSDTVGGMWAGLYLHMRITYTLTVYELVYFCSSGTFYSPYDVSFKSTDVTMSTENFILLKEFEHGFVINLIMKQFKIFIIML